MTQRVLTAGWRRGAATVVVAASVAAACTTSGGGERLEVGGVALTRAELHHGRAFVPDPAITYGPDTVHIPSGPAAVRSSTDDGMIWTLDARAEGVDRLEVGSVLLATERAVGRVEFIERIDDDVVVVLGPVELTDIIHDGDIRFDVVDLEIAEPIILEVGDQPWMVTDLPPSEDPDATLEGTPGSDDSGPSGFRAGGGTRSVSVDTDGLPPAPPDLPPDPAPMTDEQLRDLAEDQVAKRPPMPLPAWGQAHESSVGDFSLGSFCCAGGAGLLARYNQGGLGVTAKVTLVFDRLRVTGHFSVGGGKVVSGDFRVHGGGGFAYAFVATSANGLSDNVHKRVSAPGSFSIPIGAVSGIPLRIDITQSFLLRTAFSAKDSYLRASGSYSFSGEFGFTFENGTFTAIEPKDRRLRRSLLDSMRGVSVGATGIVFGHRLEFKVAIGPQVFSVGPYAGLATALGATRGSDLGSPLVVCRGAELRLDLSFGLSYRLPEIVVKVVNFILSVVGSKTVVPREGRLSAASWNAIKASARSPDLKICQY